MKRDGRNADCSIRRDIERETVYWYRSVCGYQRCFTDQDEVDALVTFSLNSMPAQFTNNSQIDCEAGEILRGADPHIHLNLFVSSSLQLSTTF